MRGGKRPNAGRKPGTRASQTIERLQRVDAVMAAVSEALPSAFQGDAHAFLIAVYKDPGNALKDRLAAATAAVGYEKPKLQAVEMNAKVEMSQEERLDLLERRANGHAAALS